MSDQLIEIEEDLTFQRREWRIQRVAWVLWGLLIAAALAGLVGSGPLSSQTAASSDGRLTVKYDRYVHHHHPVMLELAITPPEDGSELVRVRLSRALLDRISIKRIEPRPELEELSADGCTYVLRRELDTMSVKAVIYVEFDAMGRGAGEVQLTGSDAVELSYFVYP